MKFTSDFIMYKYNQLINNNVLAWFQVEVKRTVPREDMPSKGGPKTKKIFVGGIPPSLTEGSKSVKKVLSIFLTLLIKLYGVILQIS